MPTPPLLETVPFVTVRETTPTVVLGTVRTTEVAVFVPIVAETPFTEAAVQPERSVPVTVKAADQA